MTTIGHETKPADARRRQIRAMQLIFAGAAAVATLALSTGARPADAAVATGPQIAQTAPIGARVIDVNDDSPGGVNDNGQTSGDIFTQNAQDQSTANGAGT